MLRNLKISKYALIDELNIDFHQGFSVITGETGAGKSIILGAIGLILGGRADAKSIKEGADKCVIEVLFEEKSANLAKASFNIQHLTFNIKKIKLWQRKILQI